MLIVQVEGKLVVKPNRSGNVSVVRRLRVHRGTSEGITMLLGCSVRNDMYHVVVRCRSIDN